MRGEKMEDILLYYAIKYQGQFQRIYNAIIQKESIDLNELKCMKEKMTCRYTTIISNDYPECFKYIATPPFVLFYYGNLSLCKRECISMIGGRICSEYGKRQALSISCQLAKQNKVIVSGMAKGIDTYSHLGAIQANGKTIAVLGCGIDYCYPKENKSLYELLKREHLVLSEYPNDTIPKKDYFPARNRIVSAIGKKLVVVEAKQRSGTMITVNFSLEQAKEIYCVPNHMGEYDGCNRLISQGANILLDVEELF